ncbi:MAG: histidine phosphatase family protein [Pseudomonadota bacterium]|nr:histidine phosphatase family protein [Pseudomonadota bacterium]
MTGYEDCALQRNLTDAGRSQARAMATANRELAIPIGGVLASPFCRTMETARLVFGRAEATPEVRGSPASDTDDRYRALRALRSAPVAAGGNRVIVSHGNPYQAIVGSPLSRGG